MDQTEKNIAPEVEELTETNENPVHEHCCCEKNGKSSHGKCHNHDHHHEHEKELDAKIKELTSKLEQALKEKDELVEKVKLSQAELINYRRRKEEETNGLLKFANQDLIMEILPIVDNFERAIKEDDNNLTDELSKFLAGFKMMYASLTEALKKFGVEEINRVGETFDPKEEQALLTDSLPDHADEEVLEVLLKGYKLKGRVIRPASVKINQI